MRVLLSCLLLVAIAFSQTANWRGGAGVITNRISTDFNGPIAVEFHFPTNNLIVTSYYPNGLPHNFRRLDSSGAQSQWSTISGEYDEIKMALVRDNNPAGYVAGDLFTGNGDDGQVQRVTNNGNTVVRTWCVLDSGSGIGLIRGGLDVDKSNTWNGYLMVSTSNGRLYEVRPNGAGCTPYRLGTSPQAGTTLPGFLEGVTTVPNDATRYGIISSAVITANQNDGRLYYVLPTDRNTLRSFNPGCSIEDIDLVMPNENFYFINYGGGRLFGVDYTQFAGHNGDIVLTDEGGVLWELVTRSVTTPYCARIPFDSTSPQLPSGSFEFSTFAPAGVAELLPADFSLCLHASDTNGDWTNLAVRSDYKTIKYSGTETALTGFNYNGAYAAPKFVPGSLPKGTVYMWFSQDYRNEFNFNVLLAPVTGSSGQIKLTLSCVACGPLTYFSVQNDASDSYFYAQSNGAGTFTWTWTASTITKGMVFGPIDFKDATALFNAVWTVTTLTGTGINSWQLIGYQNANRWTSPGAYSYYPATVRSLTQGSQLTIARRSCNCGDSHLDKFEQCDRGAGNGAASGSCCTSECFFRPSSFVCNTLTNGVCDAIDTCSGTSGICADLNITNGKQCNATRDINNNPLCGFCTTNGHDCGPLTSACPTCASLNNCTNHGTCDGSSGNITCNCQTTPPYGGPLCNVPLCSQLTDCGSCSSHPECGWCCKEQVCVPTTLGSKSAPLYPYNNTCDIQFWRSNPSTCSCPSTCLNGGSCTNCGVCNCVPPYGGTTCALQIDCHGILGGTGKAELCGCDKGNTTCIGCDGQPFGPKYDKCGVCGGDGSSCYKLCPYETCRDCAIAEGCAWCVGSIASGTSSGGRCIQTGVDSSDDCEAVQNNSDDCAFSLTTTEAIGLSAGIVALIIIIAIIVIIACVAGSGYAGYKYWSQYRAKMTSANTNPLYQESKMQGTNPLFQDNDK